MHIPFLSSRRKQLLRNVLMQYRSEQPTIWHRIQEAGLADYVAIQVLFCWSLVESRRGAVSPGRSIFPPRSSVPVSGIQLSDWLHLAAFGGGPRCTRRSRSTPYSPKTALWRLWRSSSPSPARRAVTGENARRRGPRPAPLARPSGQWPCRRAPRLARGASAWPMGPNSRLD